MRESFGSFSSSVFTSIHLCTHWFSKFSLMATISSIPFSTRSFSSRINSIIWRRFARSSFACAYVSGTWTSCLIVFAISNTPISTSVSAVCPLNLMISFFARSRAFMLLSYFIRLVSNIWRSVSMSSSSTLPPDTSILFVSTIRFTSLYRSIMKPCCL